jgi:hypothetical protein
MEKRRCKKMDIGKDLIEYMEGYVIEELLDDSIYEYYIDEVALAINPTKVHVYLYTEDINEVIEYLTENGLSPSNNVNNSFLSYCCSIDCITMTYRSILYITITTCKEGYERAKTQNHEIQSITLKSVIKKMKSRGYKEQDIIDLLQKTVLPIDAFKEH